MATGGSRKGLSLNGTAIVSSRRRREKIRASLPFVVRWITIIYSFIFHFYFDEGVSSSFPVIRISMEDLTIR